MQECGSDMEKHWPGGRVEEPKWKRRIGEVEVGTTL